MDEIATALMFSGDQYGKAEEAIELYVSLFPDSRVDAVERAEDGQSVTVARFTLAGRPFMAMDSGVAHDFTFTPATSLFVTLDGAERVREVFEALSDGGGVLMPLGEYPFSPLFGWVNDRYGVSWQVSLS
jgi:predicted 3-demethylubiquinone-9 3-methyltransferase (glyoxalase superfamily)